MQEIRRKIKYLEENRANTILIKRGVAARAATEEVEEEERKKGRRENEGTRS